MYTVSLEPLQNDRKRSAIHTKVDGMIYLFLFSSVVMSTTWKIWWVRRDFILWMLAVISHLMEWWCVHLSHARVRLKLKILLWQHILIHMKSAFVINSKILASFCLCACLFGFSSVWCLNLKHLKWTKITFYWFTYGKYESVLLLPSVLAWVWYKVFTHAPNSAIN